MHPHKFSPKNELFSGLTFSLSDINLENTGLNLVPISLDTCSRQQDTFKEDSTEIKEFNPKFDLNQVESNYDLSETEMQEYKNTKIDSHYGSSQEIQDIVIESQLKDLELPRSSSQPFEPIQHHWLYEISESNWRPFSVLDSAKLESRYIQLCLHNNSSLSMDRHGYDTDIDDCVPVEGGRYDVHIIDRVRVAVYWNESMAAVRRASWFYREEEGRNQIPYTEQECEQLESKYAEVFMRGLWHQWIQIPKINDAHVIEDQFVFHSSHTMAQYRRYDQDDALHARVVHRGVESLSHSFERGDSEHIDHVVLVVHGIGPICDMRGHNLIECVSEMRRTSNDMMRDHFYGHPGRVEYLPVCWNSSLHTHIDSHLAKVTLGSVPKLRVFTNGALVDVLCYSSPGYCQTIIASVAAEMNRLRHLFISRNPQYDGSFSIVGHSLGAVISLDLISLQHSTTALGIPLQDPTSVPLLEFELGYLFALGSPVSLFLTARGLSFLGPDFKLSACKGVFNIFHPFDPVAYRLEPMITEKYPQRPVLVPHHKGRKRLHLELKDNLVKVGSDLKSRLLQTLKITWSSLQEFASAHSTVAEPGEDWQDDDVMRTLSKIDNGGIGDRDDCGPTTSVEGDGFVESPIGLLNGGRRVDYVLQEAPLESFNDYLFALGSHACYWDSEDTLLKILKEVYLPMGIVPDQSRPNDSPSLPHSHLAESNRNIPLPPPMPKNSLPFTLPPTNKSYPPPMPYISPPQSRFIPSPNTSRSQVISPPQMASMLLPPYSMPNLPPQMPILSKPIPSLVAPSLTNLPPQMSTTNSSVDQQLPSSTILPPMLSSQSPMFTMPNIPPSMRTHQSPSPTPPLPMSVLLNQMPTKPSSISTQPSQSALSSFPGQLMTSLPPSQLPKPSYVLPAQLQKSTVPAQPTNMMMGNPSLAKQTISSIMPPSLPVMQGTSFFQPSNTEVMPTNMSTEQNYADVNQTYSLPPISYFNKGASQTDIRAPPNRGQSFIPQYQTSNQSSVQYFQPQMCDSNQPSQPNLCFPGQYKRNECEQPPSLEAIYYQKFDHKFRDPLSSNVEIATEVGDIWATGNKGDSSMSNRDVIEETYESDPYIGQISGGLQESGRYHDCGDVGYEVGVAASFHDCGGFKNEVESEESRMTQEGTNEMMATRTDDSQIFTSDSHAAVSNTAHYWDSNHTVGDDTCSHTQVASTRVAAEANVWESSMFDVVALDDNLPVRSHEVDLGWSWAAQMLAGEDSPSLPMKNVQIGEPSISPGSMDQSYVVSAGVSVAPTQPYHESYTHVSQGYDSPRHDSPIHESYTNVSRVIESHRLESPMHEPSRHESPRHETPRYDSYTHNSRVNEPPRHESQEKSVSRDGNDRKVVQEREMVSTRDMGLKYWDEGPGVQPRLCREVASVWESSGVSEPQRQGLEAKVSSASSANMVSAPWQCSPMSAQRQVMSSEASRTPSPHIVGRTHSSSSRAGVGGASHLFSSKPLVPQSGKLFDKRKP